MKDFEPIRYILDGFLRQELREQVEQRRILIKHGYNKVLLAKQCSKTIMQGLLIITSYQRGSGRTGSCSKNLQLHDLPPKLASAFSTSHFTRGCFTDGMNKVRYASKG